MEGNIATDPSRLKGLILLDRDGVINVDHGYVHRPEDTQWLPETLEFGALASRAGFGLVIVTNQAGIGRAYYSDAQFQAYMRWMHGNWRAAPKSWLRFTRPGDSIWGQKSLSTIGFWS